MAQVITGEMGRRFQSEEGGPDAETSTGSQTLSTGSLPHEGADDGGIAELMQGLKDAQKRLDRLKDALTPQQGANLDDEGIATRKAVVNDELLVPALGAERALTYRDRNVSEFDQIEEFIDRLGSVWGFSEANLTHGMYHPEFRISKDGLYIHFQLGSLADYKNGKLEYALAEAEGRMPSISTPRGGSVWGYFSQEAITDGKLDEFLSDVDLIAGQLRFALPQGSRKFTIFAFDAAGLAMPNNGDSKQSNEVTALRELVLNKVKEMLRNTNDLELLPTEFSPIDAGINWHGSEFDDAERYKD